MKSSGFGLQSVAESNGRVEMLFDAAKGDCLASQPYNQDGINGEWCIRTNGDDYLLNWISNQTEKEIAHFEKTNLLNDFYMKMVLKPDGTVQTSDEHIIWLKEGINFFISAINQIDEKYKIRGFLVEVSIAENTFTLTQFNTNNKNINATFMGKTMLQTAFNVSVLRIQQTHFKYFVVFNNNSVRKFEEEEEFAKSLLTNKLSSIPNIRTVNYQGLFDVKTARKLNTVLDRLVKKYNRKFDAVLCLTKEEANSQILQGAPMGGTEFARVRDFGTYQGQPFDKVLVIMLDHIKKNTTLGDIDAFINWGK